MEIMIGGLGENLSEVPSTAGTGHGKVTELSSTSSERLQTN
jgi:hypothetical protein